VDNSHNNTKFRLTEKPREAAQAHAKEGAQLSKIRYAFMLANQTIGLSV